MKKYDPENVIIYPSYYLSCYYPDKTYVVNDSKTLRVPIDYHYKEIIKGYINQLNVDEIYQNITNYDISFDNFYQLTINDVEYSENNLNQFNNLCPNIIHSKKFILENFTNYRLGYSVNHPTPYYFNWLLDEISKYYIFEKINKKVDIFKNIIMPIYPKIVAHITENINNAFEHDNIIYDIKGMIEYYINAYNTMSGDNKNILLNYYLVNN